ncbi:MAG: hypothetical protein AB7S38_28750 [Vulcanimicrobiota bacterium]
MIVVFHLLAYATLAGLVAVATFLLFVDHDDDQERKTEGYR